MEEIASSSESLSQMTQELQSAAIDFVRDAFGSGM